MFISCRSQYAKLAIRISNLCTEVAKVEFNKLTHSNVFVKVSFHSVIIQSLLIRKIVNITALASILVLQTLVLSRMRPYAYISDRLSAIMPE